MESAHAYALRLLAARPYSVRDLRRRLARREYSAEESDQTVDRLCASGLLDDARYAEQFARSRLVNDAASPRRVVQMLVRYGVERGIAERAAASVVREEEVDVRAAAERVARKKMSSLGDLEPRVARRRLYAFLARRGFDVDVIRGTVLRVLT